MRLTSLTLIGSLTLLLVGGVALAQLAHDDAQNPNPASDRDAPFESVLVDADGGDVSEAGAEQSATGGEQRGANEEAETAESESVEALPPIPRRTEAASRRPDRTRELPGELGVRVENNIDGVTVCGVIVGSAGSKAGIRPGDRIVGLNGEDIRTAEEFTQKMSLMVAGDVCEIDVLRRNGLTSTLVGELEPASHVYRQHHRWSYYEPTYSHYYRPRYVGPRYYGTPRFGYHDYGWYRRGGVHIGPLHIHW